MENFNNLKKTLSGFEKDLKSISKTSNFSELSSIEKRCVHELQLAVVQVEMCGRDLKDAVAKRDKELRYGGK